MHLKRLELSGFKTFADRTELVFGPGITAIVGPNGSGKSNLADAIRWVLGETSWRALRSQRTEDVIFAGTSTRRAHGLAEVHLTVDNEDGTLPLEFTEITVTRRATRAGDSEFLLNRTPCRLRDIQTLFLGTGLGGRAYAMIGQGEVEAVLESSPAERRALLEEAAGLSRYKRRQHEAGRRLEHARQNLTRVLDRLAELEARGRELAQQAERARLYQEYQERLRRAERDLQVEEYRRVRAHLRRLSNHLQAAQQRRQEARTVAEGLHRELQQARSRAQHARAALEAVQAELVRAVEEAARAEQEARLVAQRASAAAHMRDRIRQELERFLERRGEAAAALARLREEVARRDQEVHESSLRLDHARRDVEAAQQQVRQAEEAVQAAQADLMELEHARTQAHGARAAARSRWESLASRERALRAQLDRLEQERRGLEDRRGALREELRRLEGELRAATEQLAALRHRLEALAQARGEVEQARRELEFHRQSHRARLAVLEEAQAQLLGYEAGARQVLLGQRETPGRFAGVRGALVDFLDVDREHRAAVEAALLDRLFSLVVDSWESARRVLAAVDSESTSFLVVEAVPRSGEARPPAVPDRAPGVVGLASGLVRCPPLVRGLVDAALTRTLVVEDLDAALEVLSWGWEGKVVTLAGELVTPDGLLTVRRNGSGGPLGRVQEISALRAALEELARKEEELSARWREVQAEEEAVRAQVQDLQARVEALGGQSHQVREDLARVEAQLGGQPSLEEDVRLELSQVRRQLEEARDEETRWAADLQRLGEELAEARKALERARRRHQEAEEAAKAASARLGAWQVTHAEVVASCRAARSRLDELEAEQRSAEATGARLREELEAAEEEVRRLEEAAGQAAGAAAHAAESLQRLRSASESAARAKEEAESSAAELEPRVAEAEDAVRATEEDVHRVELRAAQVGTELGALQRRIREAYGQDPEVLDSAVPERLDREALLGEVEALQGLLASLGPVNPQAVQEYREVQDRYEALQAQARDVQEAAALVAELSSRLEGVLRQRFGDTFREVNHHFQECFRRLFGGGRASLERVTLEDGEEGVEVTAQPPGKKVRSLAALSGGERVLVALALVFALLRTHPSPFCVFDEIEAALDDANTRRVVSLLQELAQRSQVVIITHNKATMEAADTLYGVTTQEPGVSSVVSMRVTRPAPEPAGVR
jgi:chromosome segregation protein